MLGVQAAVKPAHAATTFTVNSAFDIADANPGDGTCQTATAGECTFRAAIQESNAFAGADTINFAIPGTGPHNISPAFDLPPITRPVTIDGYTQSGSQVNTSTESDRTNAVLMVQLSGGRAGLSLIAGADNSVIRGLAIGHCKGNFCSNGIHLVGGTGYKGEGNFLGTQADGISLAQNNLGVFLDGTSAATIGGTTPDKRNLISGNSINVCLRNGSSGNTIVGNLIGIGKNGREFGSEEVGIGVFGAGDAGNRILSNSIFDHGGLGIDLGVDGSVEDNDDKDPDAGPNRLQNYPLISSAQIFRDPGPGSGATTNIGGELNSNPSTIVTRKKKGKKKKKRRILVPQSYTIQFFSSPSADVTGYGEGKTYLGQTQVITDLQGKAAIPFSTRATSKGEFTTATATNNGTGDTSEFSEAKIVKEPGTAGG